MKETVIVLFGNLICPYSQRAEIALQEGLINYKLNTIDFLNKPDWFESISPLGRIPILKVGQFTIFESIAIIEYINDISIKKFMPDDAVGRAVTRSLCQYVEHLHVCSKHYFMAANNHELKIYGSRLIKAIDQFFNQLLPMSYRAKNIDMISIYLAPFFILLDVLDTKGPIRLLINPRATAIKKTLLSRIGDREFKA